MESCVEQIIINKLRIEHTKITHQHLLKKIYQNATRAKKIINVEHILLHSAEYEYERMKHEVKSFFTDLLNSPHSYTKVIKCIKDINIQKCNLICNQK